MQAKHICRAAAAALLTGLAGAAQAADGAALFAQHCHDALAFAQTLGANDGHLACHRIGRPPCGDISGGLHLRWPAK